MEYNETFDADNQVTAEEKIAATIFSYQEHQTSKLELVERFFGEEDCAELGRRILLQVLTEFRPDLFDGWKPQPTAAERDLHSALGVVIGSLDDASGVVDAGEDEDYAYQHELELGRDCYEKYRHLDGISTASVKPEPFKIKFHVFADGKDGWTDDYGEAEEWFVQHIRDGEPCVRIYRETYLTEEAFEAAEPEKEECVLHVGPFPQ